MQRSLGIELEGYYGKYQITNDDELEVKKYRIALLICGISFVCGLSHWLIIGPSFAWVWLLIMSVALGLALKWIHIYIHSLHQLLQGLWAIGTLGILILLFKGNSQEMLTTIASNKISIIFIGPYFAALTGLGFKEFFCFRRPEAIGVTIFLPISLTSHLLGILNEQSVMLLLCISSILLLILSLRKFGMDAASDIGDKSVFEYLKNQRNLTNV